MILNKKQTKSRIYKLSYIACLFISHLFFINHLLFAQDSYKLNEMEINRAINSDEKDNLDLPTNPFDIVDRIIRSNSMNDATNPSDAIDEAIKSFDIIKEEKQI